MAKGDEEAIAVQGSAGRRVGRAGCARQVTLAREPGACATLYRRVSSLSRESTMPTTNALAGVAVSNLAESIEWYARLLDRSPDAQPIPTAAEWKFEGGGWLRLFQDANRAGASSVMLSETSLDERTQDCKAKGLPIASINHSGFLNTAVINDPDGNEIVFVETLGVRHPSLD
jgi:hypothetical protein